MKPRRMFVLLALVCLDGAGCATSTMKPAVAARVSATGQWVRTELYLAAVDATRWREFLASNVTPKFPAGFTVWDAYGQWRSSSGEIRVVPSRILVVLHPSTAQANAAIEAIRHQFKTQFNQESVLRATTPAKVGF